MALDLSEPIWEQHLRGWQALSYSGLARRLNAEGVPTRGGGQGIRRKSEMIVEVIADGKLNCGRRKAA